MEGGGDQMKTLQEVFTYINQLTNPETRENALLELSKKRESVADLALMLWNSFGTIAGTCWISHLDLNINPLLFQHCSKKSSTSIPQ
jgi:predicted SprT family Zn-dependent metalloprotease